MAATVSESRAAASPYPYTLLVVSLRAPHGKYNKRHHLSVLDMITCMRVLIHTEAEARDEAFREAGVDGVPVYISGVLPATQLEVLLCNEAA